MTRNLKKLGIAFVAALAMCTVGASAAEAAPEFTCSSYPCQLTGSNSKGSEVFTTEAGAMECDSHWLSGSLFAPTSALAFTASTSNCEAFGYIEATINAEGCTYVLSGTELVSAGVYQHHVNINCPAGKSIKITSGTCKAEIKPQTGLTSVKSTNSGSSIILNWQLAGMAYTVTQDGFLCPFSGTGNKTGMSYSGEITQSRVGGGSVAVS